MSKGFYTRSGLLSFNCIDRNCIDTVRLEEKWKTVQSKIRMEFGLSKYQERLENFPAQRKPERM
jgi:hypothetical protein